MTWRLKFRGGRNWQVEEDGRALPLGHFGRFKHKALAFIRDMIRWRLYDNSDPKKRPASNAKKYGPD